jgi:hypothetical protein
LKASYGAFVFLPHEVNKEHKVFLCLFDVNALLSVIIFWPGEGGPIGDALLADHGSASIQGKKFSLRTLSPFK